MSKIGLVIPYWSDITKDEIIDFATLGEDLRYDSIWVPEMWGRDAFSILSVIALNTKKIKLGTGIIPVYSRTPAIIAQTIATLDEISKGRMILGLGTSGPAVIENWHGVKYEKPLRRTREYVEIIRQVIGGGRVNYDGEIFQLKNFRLQFKPYRNDIPIYIASIGRKNVQLTGEIADGWIPFLVPIQSLEETIERLYSGARDSGRDPERIKISPYFPALVSHDVDLAIKLVKEHIAFYVGSMGTYYYKLMNRHGFGTDAESITGAMKKGTKSDAFESVSDSLLNSVSIAGSPEEGKRTIDEFRKAGADLPILIFPPKATREIVKETIKQLAQ